jgi:polysaccharide biosynthesis transport protein
LNIPETTSLAPRRPGTPPPPKRVDLLDSLRRHIAISFLLFVVLAAAGSYLALQRDVLTFGSSAEVHVARNFQRTLQNDRELELRNTQEYDIFRNEQIGLLTRYDVLEDALSRCNQLESGVWAPLEAGPGAAVVTFASALDVYLLPRTYRISLDLVGTNPEILQPALDALLAAFLDAHRTEFFFDQDQRPVILRAALAEVDASIALKRTAVRELGEQLNVLDFKQNHTNPWIAPLESARLALVETERKEKNLRAELEANPTPTATQADLEMALLGGASGMSEGLAQLVAPLVERRTELVSRLLDMGPGHPGRGDLEQKIKSLESQVEEILQHQAAAANSARDAELAQLTTLVGQLKQEVKDLGASGQAFVTSFQEGMVVEAALGEDLARRTELKSRLSFFEIETKSPSYVRVVQSASAVGTDGVSKLMRNLALVGILAALIAFGLPLMFDFTDKRVHTTQDIEAVFGFPPAIWIPEPKKGAQMNLAEDQIRRFALALDRDQSYARSRLIQFTEVKHGKGAQDVVENIAMALTGFGRKILVVDAAAPRRARLAKNYTTVGFLGLMAGKGLEVISKEGFDFLEYGNPMVESGQVFSGWDDILRDAAGDYDMVLIRADPLLGSPDAEHMASSVDLVVLMVEAERQTRGEIQRAGDVLASLHPAAVGTLLHNAKIFRSHGYYRELLKERKALPPR